jgi:hypothetical protein
MKDEKHISNKITTSEKFDVVNMGISEDPEDQKMILNILTNTLYTDKISAVLREYGCNAADANVEAGKPEVPIKVHIPTPGEPYFSVRDVGGGMTEDQILKVFCRLGRSTKRNSNAYTGMLGIGSKAGFAYGNSFLVTSFNKGIRTVYNCFRDAVGLPQMAKMDASPTTEEDGIEVKLSVRGSDVAQFQITAEKTYQHFRVPPLGISRDERDIICQGPKWRITKTRESIAVMGNVGYDIASEYVLPILNSGSYGIGVELDFEIGELEVAANREGLQYKDHTQKAIRERVKEVISELPNEVTKKVSTAASIWEARTSYQAIHRCFPRLAGTGVTWKGQKLSLNFELPSFKENEFSLIQWGKRSYGKSLRKQYPIRISSRTALFLKDKCSYTGRRLKEFLFQKSKTEGDGYDYDLRMETNTAILFNFKTDKARKEFWKEHDLDGAVLTPVSTLPLPPACPSAPRVSNTKYTAQVFTFTPSINGATYYKDSDWWTISPQNLKTGKGIYVPIFNFGVSTTCANGRTGWVSLPGLREQLKTLTALGLFKGSLYGVKDKSVPLLGKGWIPLKDFLDNAFSTLLQNNTYAQDVANHIALSKHTNLFCKDTEDFMDGSAAERYMKAKKNVMNKNSKLLDMLVREQLKPWLAVPDRLPKPTIDLEKLTKDIYERYPMFQALREYNVRALPIEVVVEYVNLVEKSKK